MASTAKKICFVVGALGEPDSDVRIHADWLLEEIIEPVFAELHDFEVVRSDKIAAPGMIDAQIIGHLLDSEVVIADLSGLNPNAFYEIGLRHMIQKPIVHMQLVDDKIPFDVSLYRAIKFSRVRPSDIRRAREDLKAAIKSVLNSEYKVDNPVTRARGQINLHLEASSTEKVLADQMDAMMRRVTELESLFPTNPVGHESFTVERSYVRDSLTVEHVPIALGTTKAREFRMRLREAFDGRLGKTRSTPTTTIGDVDVSGGYEKLEEIERRVMAIPEVKSLSIIPF